MSELELLVIGDLIVEKPITQGGMGVSISLHKLAGAMAKVGGMDTILAAQIGFREPDLTTSFVEADVESICKEMRLARGITPQDVIGLDIMIAIKYYDMQIKEAAKAGADIVISGAGLPISLPEYVEAAYAEMKEKPARRIKLVPIVSSAKSVMTIRKMWDKKCHIAPDLVVVEEPLAGSHLGFSLDQLSTYGADTADVPATYDQDAYDRKAEAVMKVVEEYGDKYSRHIPVVMTDGIYTHRDVMRQLELGVGGIQVATKFMMIEEYDASDAYKQVYINTGKENIIITQSPVGMPRGAILNSLLSRIKGGSRLTVKSCLQCLEHCDIGAILYCITIVLVDVAEGDTDHGLLSCGGNIYRAEKIDTVDNVMRELTGELT